MAENAGLPLLHTVTPEQTELIGIGRILRVMRAFDLKETVLNPPLREAAKQKYPFHEVEIPVAGFHWLDFTVNEDEATFVAMAFRGWEATMRTGYFQNKVDASQRQANPFVLT